MPKLPSQGDINAGDIVVMPKDPRVTPRIEAAFARLAEIPALKKQASDAYERIKRQAEEAAVFGPDAESLRALTREVRSPLGGAKAITSDLLAALADAGIDGLDMNLRGLSESLSRCDQALDIARLILSGSEENAARKADGMPLNLFLARSVRGVQAMGQILLGLPGPSVFRLKGDLDGVDAEAILPWRKGQEAPDSLPETTTASTVAFEAETDQAVLLLDSRILRFGTTEIDLQRASARWKELKALADARCGPGEGFVNLERWKRDALVNKLGPEVRDEMLETRVNYGVRFRRRPLLLNE